MYSFGRLRGRVAGAISGCRPVVSSATTPSVHISNRLLSSGTASTSRASLLKPAHASPVPKLNSPRFYSSNTTKPQRALYFSPAAWILIALASGVAGATAVLMSTTGFITYSDKESLKIFLPMSEKQVEVEEYITNHPLTKSLRLRPDLTESRPTLKIHESYRPSSLTSGALAGSGKIEVPPFVFADDEGKEFISILYLGDKLCGYPGMIHGGLLATLLDEGLARCSFPALPNKIAMTANLTINYRKPCPAGSFIVLKAKTVKVEGRKAWVEGHIETLVPEGQKPVVLVEASSLMVEPRQAKVGNPFHTYRELC
jgi:acyl-coenzyme A thioesterase PaaI-like protein